MKRQKNAILTSKQDNYDTASAKTDQDRRRTNKKLRNMYKISSLVNLIKEQCLRHGHVQISSTKRFIKRI